MKCKKCNVELIGYTSSFYPNESGYKCSKCGREWSDLQISRAKGWNCSEKELAEVGADGIIFNIPFPEFKAFSKIPRYSRECIITEKIDGTNSVIYIDEENNIFAGSHSRWLWGSIQDEIHNDNHGFAKWVKDNKEELLKLGKGYHYGEWWGKGIQRNYGLSEKRFSLFNVSKWNDEDARPKCCGVVPILYEGEFDTVGIRACLDHLEKHGSYAAPGYMKPEGIVIFHTASGHLYKKTILNDEKPKSQVKE